MAGDGKWSLVSGVDYSVIKVWCCVDVTHNFTQCDTKKNYFKTTRKRFFFILIWPFCSKTPSGQLDFLLKPMFGIQAATSGAKKNETNTSAGKTPQRPEGDVTSMFHTVCVCSSQVENPAIETGNLPNKQLHVAPRSEVLHCDWSQFRRRWKCNRNTTWPTESDYCKVTWNLCRRCSDVWSRQHVYGTTRRSGTLKSDMWELAKDEASVDGKPSPRISENKCPQMKLKNNMAF